MSSTSTSSASQNNPEAQSRNPFRQVAAAVVGNTVEWYDWYCYSLLAIYFAKQFFPSDTESSLVPLLSALAVFAIGFFMRPLGGLLFGMVGDRYGRKRALQTTVALMGVGSILIAVCPTYAQAGIAGPIILVIARLIQGISAGGELGSASAFLVESAPPKRRGLFSSFFYVGATAGNIAAVGSVALLAGLLSDSQLESWGWRLPFVLGAIASLSAMWIRRSTEETFAAKDELATRERPRVFDFVRQYPVATLRVIGMMAAPALAFYTWAVFLPTFAQLSVNADKSDTFIIGLISLLYFWVIVPFFGMASDRWGRKPLLYAFAIGSIVLTVPLISSITSGFGRLLVIQLIGMTILACFMSIQAVVFSELFPARFRAVGIGAPYGVTVALFGGTGPYLATWMIDMGKPVMFGWYIVAISLVSLLVYWRLPELSREPLRD